MLAIDADSFFRSKIGVRIIAVEDSAMAEHEKPQAREFQQRRFSFDESLNDDFPKVPEIPPDPPHGTEESAPGSAPSPTPLFVRPDRQVPLGSESVGNRPKPIHDADTISVDRIREDIDGPGHRFFIKWGDTVEVFLSAEKVEIGKAVGISHARGEVQVRFKGAPTSLWFPVDQIYPALESDHFGTGHRLRNR